MDLIHPIASRKIINQIEETSQNSIELLVTVKMVEMKITTKFPSTTGCEASALLPLSSSSIPVYFLVVKRLCLPMAVEGRYINT